MTPDLTARLAKPELDALAEAYDLSPFERDVLGLAVAAELDPSLPSPTFQMALETLPDAHWSALLPSRPLRAARLVTLGDGPLLVAPLGADERVLHHLHGLSTIDERLEPYVRSVPLPPHELPASRQHLVDVLAQQLDGTLTVTGRDHADLLDLVASAAHQHERVAWFLAGSELPATPLERDGFVRLWQREVVLTGAVLVVDLDDGVRRSAVEELCRRVEGAVVVVATEPVGLDGHGFTVPPLTADEQEALWARTLDPIAAASMAAEFDLGAADIVSVRSAETRQACVARVRERLSGLAERIEPKASWDDLVLPEAQMRLVRQLAAAARGRRAAHARGSGRITDRGAGVTALFTGPSGTGKTLAAEIVAAELDLDLHRIDLALTMSKWIGETEKHLRQIFDAAESGGTVLLFDEADALFGRRTEVRDSHDRYANLEVSYLLQRMEQYRGVAVLTSNLRSAIDSAFMRRLRFVVNFPHPDAALRRALWERELAGVDLEPLGLDRLSGLDFTGGDISSVAARARLLAAADAEPVNSRHLMDAVVAEYAKLDRPLPHLGDMW